MLITIQRELASQINDNNVSLILLILNFYKNTQLLAQNAYGILSTANQSRPFCQEASRFIGPFGQNGGPVCLLVI